MGKPAKKINRSSSQDDGSEMTNFSSVKAKERLDQSQLMTYLDAGVRNNEELELKSVLQLIKSTFTFRKETGLPVLDLGYFANVINVGHNLGIAISTDGVGTKILIAEMLGKYDTIGIDCIAMNVNDVICVGAEPTTMVDYIAVEEARPELLKEIAKGLVEGAHISNINIPAGEIAQVPELIKGYSRGSGCDVVGTCIGLVDLDKIIVGQNLQAGDVVIGIASSGVHSNGLTLARKALLEKGKYNVDTFVPELGRTIGEELLKPTHIYVREVMELIKSGLSIKALVHITSDGFLNLARIDNNLGYVIESLPDPQPIFNIIQRAGIIANEEMFRVFNMGIGFCVVLEPKDVDRAISIIKKHGVEATQIGHVIDDPERRVQILPYNLIGEGDHFLSRD